LQAENRREKARKQIVHTGVIIFFIIDSFS
jgi:hypothetical protein